MEVVVLQHECFAVIVVLSREKIMKTAVSSSGKFEHGNEDDERHEEGGGARSFGLIIDHRSTASEQKVLHDNFTRLGQRLSRTVLLGVFLYLV